MPTVPKDKRCEYKNCKKAKQNDSTYCVKHVDGEEVVKKTDDKYRNDQKDSTKKGDETEDFVCEILSQINGINNIQKIGHSGSIYDVLYNYKNQTKKRALQVKTMSVISNRPNSFLYRIHNSTEPETLVVGVSLDRKSFSLIFRKDAPESGNLFLTFSESGRNVGKYTSNKFTDIKKFKKQLSIMLRESVFYDENKSLYSCIQKEQDSLERLRIKATENNVIYEDAKTRASRFDCFINGFSIQHKYAKIKKCQSVDITIAKSGKSTKGKKTTIPYSVADKIDFFVFEVKEQIGNFYIIPSKVLEEKYLSDKNGNGGGKSITFSINPKRNRFIEYYNAFDLFV